MKNKPLIEFKGWTCELIFSRYIENDQIAIYLIDLVTGDHVLSAAMFAEEIEIPRNHVLIKDHLECEGLAIALSKAGVIRLTGKKHFINHANALEAKVLRRILC